MRTGQTQRLFASRLPMFATKRLTRIVLLLNGFILIGAGHSIGPLFLFELFQIPWVFGVGLEELTLSYPSNADEAFSALTFFSMLGNLFFLFSFLTRPARPKALVKLLGLALFWLGYAYVVALAFRNADAYFTAITGLPFFALSIWLFAKTYMQTAVRAKDIQN